VPFPFTFIDPTGWEPPAINLITPILRLEPGEVLINLMTSWIRRFISDKTTRIFIAFSVLTCRA